MLKVMDNILINKQKKIVSYDLNHIRLINNLRNYRCDTCKNDTISLNIILSTTFVRIWSAVCND